MVVDKFGYDGLKESTTTDKDSKHTDKSDTTKEGDLRKLGSFVTYSSYSSLSQEDYKLYDAWTLDNALDVHVCNDIQRSDFR